MRFINRCAMPVNLTDWQNVRHSAGLFGRRYCLKLTKLLILKAAGYCTFAAPPSTQKLI